MIPRGIPNRTLEHARTEALASLPGARLPWAGQWELTCACNLRCVMCYTDCFNTPARIGQELATDEILRILDELDDAGCIELTFTGGEPLSRPDFLTIYDEAHRRGFVLTVFTNGTLITTQIADRWAVARPAKVEISLHGVSAEVFDGVTQVPGSLKRCLAGIRRLSDRRIPMVLKTVGLTGNVQEILDAKRFADELGSETTWRFGQYLRDDLAETGAPFRFQVPEERLRSLQSEDPQLREAKRDEIARSEAPPDRQCGGGALTFHIDARGRLQLCSNNRRAGYDLRTGSFRRGFFEALPAFPCPRRTDAGAQPMFVPLTRRAD